jgi:hypothetical protein
MNVRQLIEELEKIEDKTLEVKWSDRYGMGGDCCSNDEYHYHYDYNEPELEDVDEVRIEQILVPKYNSKGRMLKTMNVKTVIVVG